MLSETTALTEQSPAENDIQRLIRKFETEPLPWIVEGLWKQTGILIVHGQEATFKSVLVFQLAEAIARGGKFLGIWKVSSARRVGIFESEMSDQDSGERLKRMFPDTRSIPTNLHITDDEFRREINSQPTIELKFQKLDRWVRDKGIEIVAFDTINGLLAVCGNPNDERAISRFYGCLSLLPVKGSLLVRHDCKPSRDTEIRGENQTVRGSNRIVEDATTVIRLQRTYKPHNQVRMRVGKLRESALPEGLDLWLDAGTFRLTLLPPVFALLGGRQLTREQLLEEAQSRFNMKRASVDAQIAEYRAYLQESNDGRKRLWELNLGALPSIDLSEENSSLKLAWWRRLWEVNIENAKSGN
jgi:hypothetical protein